MLRFIAIYIFPPQWLLFTQVGQAYLAWAYRYWCPGSMSLSARECNRRGECGCNNMDRFR